LINDVSHVTIPYMLGEPPGQSRLVDRIKDSDKVDRFELAKELGMLAGSKDRSGMQQLFDAYLGWERSHNTSRGVEEIKELAMTNLDYLAFHVDISDGNVVNTLGLSAAEDAYRLTKETRVGNVRAFLRESIGYQPPSA